MPANKFSLNTFLSCLEAKGFEVKFHYDRVKLYADSANKKTKLDRVCMNENQHTISPRALLHYDDMGLIIDTHQPDTAYFGRLKKALTGDYVINYAEFAMDILVRNKKQVFQLRSLLNQLLVLERKRCRNRFYHNNYKKTHYFGQRYKHKEILVIYCDKFSKAALGRHCVHIEVRLYGSKILKGLGIYTIQDLTDFDHEKIWDKYLDLRDVNYTKLGRLVTEEKASLSDSSYRRHGQNCFDKYTGSQALLQDHPEFVTAFAAINNRRMFESRLDNALQ